MKVLNPFDFSSKYNSNSLQSFIFDLQSFIDLVAIPHTKKTFWEKFCFMQKDDMISFAPPLSVLILCVHLEHQVKYSGNSLPSSALSFYPLSLSLPLFAQLPVCSTAPLCQLIYPALSKPLRRRSLSLRCTWKRCWVPNPRSGMNISLLPSTPQVCLTLTAILYLISEQGGNSMGFFLVP